MYFSFKTSVLCICVLVVSLWACKKETNGDSTTNSDFDRKAMLTNMGTNLIIPGYQRLDAAVQLLDTSIVAFNQNPNEANLEVVQQNFKAAYKAWEYTCSFEFGPAEQQYLGKNVNTFPTDVAQITANVTSGSYNLDAIANWDAKGLPALDYLLFGVASDNASIVLQYTTETSAANRKLYLASISTDMKHKINGVLSAWKSGYLDVFVNSAGTDIGSGTSYLYNGFVMGYEVLKNYKFSLPLGRMMGQTTSSPEKVEAYYSGYSTELAKDHWNSTNDIWEGKGLNGVDGIGFHEYLASVEGGTDLITKTQQQQTNVINVWAAMPAGRLSDAITQQFDKVDAVNTELQKLTRFYKSDMSSLLGITITFNSGDGD